MRNYPWYKGWHDQFAKKGVTLLGVHTPETEGEAKVEQVKKKVKEIGFAFPIAVDNDQKNWQAWGNRWWPSVYLIDKKGDVRYRWDGELNYRGVKGEEGMRKKIEELLAEKD